MSINGLANETNRCSSFHFILFLISHFLFLFLFLYFYFYIVYVNFIFVPKLSFWYFLIKGCAKSSGAEGRSSGAFCKHEPTKSQNSGENEPAGNFGAGDCTIKSSNSKNDTGCPVCALASALYG
jgi:hypothetical protein